MFKVIRVFAHEGYLNPVSQMEIPASWYVTFTVNNGPELSQPFAYFHDFFTEDSALEYIKGIFEPTKSKEPSMLDSIITGQFVSSR